MRISRERRRQTFELRLTAGDPIIIQLRDAYPSEAKQNNDAEPTEETQEATEAEDDTAPDVTSLADLLHALEGVAGEGRSWFRERGWVGAWPSGDEADLGGEEA